MAEELNGPVNPFMEKVGMGFWTVHFRGPSTFNSTLLIYFSTRLWTDCKQITSLDVQLFIRIYWRTKNNDVSEQSGLRQTSIHRQFWLYKCFGLQRNLETAKTASITENRNVSSMTGGYIKVPYNGFPKHSWDRTGLRVELRPWKAYRLISIAML